MLQISWRSEYGLLFLVALARTPSGSYLSLKKVAFQYRLPYRFLSQIATQLKKAGLVESKEGVHGGYFLAKKPHKISFYDVVALLESASGIIGCRSGQDCPHADTCQIKSVWQQVHIQVNHVLTQFTVADLLKSTSTKGNPHAEP